MGDSEIKSVYLKKGKATPFLYRHPWVFSGAIGKVPLDVADGDLVALHGHGDDFIAWGFYNSLSQIRMRLYSWDREILPDCRFFSAKIAEAARLRRDVLGLPHECDAYRLVYSESDGLSGLIADRYGDYLALQVNSLAMMQRIGDILPALEEACRPRGIILRNEADTNRQEGIDTENGPLGGEMPAAPVTITQHGVKYEIDLGTGQKTGFYLDQRENRKAAGAYCRGKKVLDLCCYTGGFSIHAAMAGAAHVTGVDVSAPAIAQAVKNAELNGAGTIEFVKEDVFRFLEDPGIKGRYDTVILDPPRFAPSHGAVDGALKGYARLNTLAMKALAPDGILVTCSCSGRVSEEQFTRAVLEAAKQSVRTVQILESRGQPADHPVSIFCPETRYLKCLVCRVV